MAVHCAQLLKKQATVCCCMHCLDTHSEYRNTHTVYHSMEFYGTVVLQNGKFTVHLKTESNSNLENGREK